MKKNLKVLLISLLLSLPFWYGVNFFQENLEKFFYAQIAQPIEEITLVKIPEKTQKPNLELQARAAISMKINEVGREKIFFKKNIDQPLPIASLTKLMTAVIVLENFGDNNLSKKVIVSPEAASQEDVPPAYDVNLTAGQVITLGELLDRMLIYSVNDAAFALAEAVDVENEGNFVKEMNQKAIEWGLTNTHFVNPAGLDPENENLHSNYDNLVFFNYSTAKDLATLSQRILEEYPLIFAITLKEGGYKKENGISTLQLPKDQFFFGGKTGYTDEAGGCMLLVLEDEKGNKLINIILGAPSSSARIEEMQKLIDWLNI
jgi:D-alanyl-D-alanine carboxypeptidase (penicillin-binding protein 5/6)